MDVVGKLSAEGVGVVVAGVGVAAGAGALKVVGAGAGALKVEGTGAGVLKIDVAGAGVVNILWGAAGVAAICAGAAAICTCTCARGSWIAFLKRLILYESYATTSSTTMNASTWSRIGIVQPGTANAIVASVAMITLTPSVSAYNKFAFKLKLMSVWSR